MYGFPGEMAAGLARVLAYERPARINALLVFAVVGLFIAVGLMLPAFLLVLTRQIQNHWRWLTVAARAADALRRAKKAAGRWDTPRLSACGRANSGGNHFRI